MKNVFLFTIMVFLSFSLYAKELLLTASQEKYIQDHMVEESDRLLYDNLFEGIDFLSYLDRDDLKNSAIELQERLKSRGFIVLKEVEYLTIPQTDNIFLQLCSTSFFSDFNFCHHESSFVHTQIILTLAYSNKSVFHINLYHSETLPELMDSNLSRVVFADKIEKIISKNHLNTLTVPDHYYYRFSGKDQQFYNSYAIVSSYHDIKIVRGKELQEMLSSCLDDLKKIVITTGFKDLYSDNLPFYNKKLDLVDLDKIQPFIAITDPYGDEFMQVEKKEEEWREELFHEFILENSRFGY